MGICPRCGSWVDEGEPYCPECLYDGSKTNDDPIGFSALPDVVNVNGTPPTEDTSLRRPLRKWDMT